jgi:hypothetical protein
MSHELTTGFHNQTQVQPQTLLAAALQVRSMSAMAFMDVFAAVVMSATEPLLTAAMTRAVAAVIGLVDCSRSSA